MNKVNNEHHHGDDRVGGLGWAFPIYELLLNIEVVVKTENLKPTDYPPHSIVLLLISVTLPHLKILIFCLFNLSSLYLHSSVLASQKIEKDF